MKKLLYKSSLLALAAGMVLTSCDPEIDAPALSSGQADFSKYVAVGNSLTAGFSNNGLYREGQLSSYPAILAKQFAQVGGGAFVQPLFSEAELNGSGFDRLDGFTPTGLPILTKVTDKRAIVGMGSDGKTPLFTKFLEPVSNLGVPGIKMTDVTTAGYGFNNPQGFNPYYERLLPNDATPAGGLLPYVNKVAATKPTFFTMWLGNNDVLSYATSGGLLPISSSAAFQTGLDAMVNALVSQNNAKGAILNIPDVIGMPFFTTKSTAQLMQLAAASSTKLYITTGQNNVREATVKDFILLTSTVGVPEQVGSSTIPHGFSPFNPLKNGEVLDDVEITAINTATIDFNARLAAAAQTKGLALIDMNSFFNSAKMKDNMPQLTLNGVAYTPSYITGNLFSLDGVHLTPRGYAIVSNFIIKNINAKYGSSVPFVDETKYKAVQLP